MVDIRDVGSMPTPADSPPVSAKESVVTEASEFESVIYQRNKYTVVRPDALIR